MTTSPSITIDDLRGMLHWLPVGELAGPAELACIDGRFHGCVLGAPGGDAGELILLLGGLERATGDRFSDEAIDEVVACELARHGRFYLHSDRHRLDHIAAALGGEFDEALAEAGSIEALLRHPPQAVRARLEELLVDAQYNGCGHLRTMLGHWDDYEVRRELVEAVILGFFRQLWDGHPDANFTVLEGDPEEEAVIHIDTEQTLAPETLVPSVCAHEQGPSIFVNHLAARRFKRRIDLELLAEVSDLVGPAGEQREALLDDIAELAELQAGVTVSHLAADLPAYRVDFEDRELTIHR